MDAYEFVVCQLLSSTADRIQQLAREGKLDALTAKNQSQAHYYRPLSVAYGEALFLRRMKILLEDNTIATDQLRVLRQLAALYGNCHLQKHLAALIGGGYFAPETAAVVRASVELLCTQVKSEAVALVDAIAPVDFVLDSALGHSDGRVYHHLEERMAPGMKKRPDWWQLVIQKPNAHL